MRDLEDIELLYSQGQYHFYAKDERQKNDILIRINKQLRIVCKAVNVYKTVYSDNGTLIVYFTLDDIKRGE